MHVIDVDRDIMEINRRISERNQRVLEENNVFGFDVLGAIGSGKTSLIEALVGRIGKKLGIGAIAGDVISDADASRLKRCGIPVIGLNTGRECHLDAHLVEHALESLPLKDLDILFIENVGNLICPVDFPLGAHRRIVVVSVSEGDDTVEKHPMIFLDSDLAVINKIDIAEAVDASVEKMEYDAKRINPRLPVIKTSMKKGIGLNEIVDWIRKESNL
ncbi:MAG: hydrogenase nickel incorporation protein HypB [Candidatus Altiarchaeota archaeon]|nr:hydrogenase nickel incorporation protein HypB [Candidatus Altiarchaeota archaeon]